MCSRLGYTRLGSLRVGDHIIATNLVFVYNGVVYGFRMAFDRDWGRYGPGVLLLNFMIRNLTEEGVHHFEMGDGVTEHKARWSTGLRMDMHLRTSGRVGPQLMMQSIQAGQGLWKVVKRALPSSARDSIRRALGYGLPGIVDEQAEALEES
jgi:CelD/BcsL family acetyltransferase involved in cellulose biosynthesis